MIGVKTREKHSLSPAAARGKKSTSLSSIVSEALCSPGRPLDTATQLHMESRFRHDFSQVRIHTNSDAASSAQAVNASAYTVGRHIVFDSGRFEPRNRRGQALLAHELAHTMQQDHGTGGLGQLSLGEPSDECEKEAGRAASAAVNGVPFSVGTRRPLGVQRQSKSDTVPDVNLGESASPFMAGAIGSVTVDAFETGKADISGDNHGKLVKEAETIRTLLAQYPASVIKIMGHTDAVGQEKDNQVLGQARADAVRAALVDMGIPASAISSQSYGAEKLLVKTQKAEPRNRRVEIRFEPAQRPGGSMTSGAASTAAPTADVSHAVPPISGDPCALSPELCLGKQKGPPGLPPAALQPLPSATPFHLMDIPSLNEPFISHGNRPETGGDLRQTWAALYWKYRRGWGLSEELAAKAANMELARTIGTSQSRDYPNALDQSNSQFKEAYPNATTIGPANITLFRF